MQQLQRFEEGRDGVDARNAEPLEEGVRRGIRAGERGGMRDRRGARLFGAADLHRDDRLLQLARPRRQPLEAGDAVEAFDVQAERRDAVVLDQPERHFRQAGLRLVAGRHQEGDRQAALLHGEVAGDVGRLRDDADAARVRREPHAAMLVGPQQRAVGIVDQAVAVRPDDRHVAGSLDQLALQPLAVGIVAARFEEAGGIADRAAGAARRKLADRCRA